MWNVHAILFITSGKKMSNNGAPCFSKISLAVIPSYKELTWIMLCIWPSQVSKQKSYHKNQYME